MLKNLLYSPAGGYLCYLKLTHSSTQTTYSLLYRYVFEGWYFGTIMGSVKIANTPTHVMWVMMVPGVVVAGHNVARIVVPVWAAVSVVPVGVVPHHVRSVHTHIIGRRHRCELHASQTRETTVKLKENMHTGIKTEIKHSTQSLGQKHRCKLHASQTRETTVKLKENRHTCIIKDRTKTPGF